MIPFQSMFKKTVFAVLSLAAAHAVHPAVPPNPGMPPVEQVREIVVQNRILTKVNGKNISVLDVMKKMDVFLSQNFPQYMDSKTARFQFYSTQWRPTLMKMVNQELMLADAEKLSEKVPAIKVSDGDTREEIQTRFGPNVMATLDKLGITYDEAREMVQQDLTVQKMQWVRVTSKVVQKVTAKEVKNAYVKFLKENPPKENWKYQFLTIRSADETAGQALASKLAAFKEKAENSLTVAADLFKEQLPPEEAPMITVSQEFDQEEKELSEANREVLSSLEKGTWSAPVVQLSRDGTKVVRIFHLKGHTKHKPPVFTAVANELKNNLLNETFEEENNVYVAKLHQRFSFDDKSLEIPPHFEPFAAR
jgi:hypothetical protein